MDQVISAGQIYVLPMERTYCHHIFCSFSKKEAKIQIINMCLFSVTYNQYFWVSLKRVHLQNCDIKLICTTLNKFEIVKTFKVTHMNLHIHELNISHATVLSATELLNS